MFYKVKLVTESPRLFPYTRLRLDNTGRLGFLRDSCTRDGFKSYRHCSLLLAGYPHLRLEASGPRSRSCLPSLFLSKRVVRSRTGQECVRGGRRTTLSIGVSRPISGSQSKVRDSG